MKFKVPKLASPRQQSFADARKNALRLIRSFQNTVDFDEWLEAFDTLQLRKGVITHYGPHIAFEPAPYWRGIKWKLASLQCSHDSERHVKDAWFRCMDCNRWREGETAE